MELFRTYADVYKSFDEFAQDSREGIFFYRLGELDNTTVYPLLLEVVKRHNTADGREELRKILADLESFLVRRVICELTPKNYNKLFVELVKELCRGTTFSAEEIRGFLLRQEAEISRWPSDEEFKKAWMGIHFYKRVKQKGRMILEALEAALHTGKTEKVQIERDLTIEHLLPREWDRNWPLPVGDGSPEDVKKKAEHREDMLHRIGNLSLLTKKLNPSVSNGPWDRKLKEILKHSVLNLNRTLPEKWDEELIEARSKELFTIALRVWPHP